VSFELILPFFPEELRGLLLDPSISDLMINGTTGVYADRAGVIEHIVVLLIIWHTSLLIIWHPIMRR
jgi:pilus assembly protein CpaF